MVPYPIVFLHIPKTAGTSFRNSLETTFPKEIFLYDYGVDSELTSKIVKESIDKKTGHRHLKHLNSSQVILSGHFHAVEYLDSFHPNHFWTFLRDPIQRTISEYQHFVRHNGYQDSLQAFTKTYANRQVRLLSGIELSHLGFLGITERYQASISLFYQQFGIQLPYLATNVARQHLKETYNIDENTIRMISDYNQKDIQFYQKAIQEFDDRIQRYQEMVYEPS